MRVQIRNGKNKTYRYGRQIQSMGFLWKESNRCWEKDCEKQELRQIERFCRKKRLKMVSMEERYCRNNSYRKTFFASNHGIRGQEKYYWCAYCGKIIPRSKVTVDHIIPVQKVSQGEERKKYQRKLKRRGIVNVNQKENLVAACQRCNQKKAARTGTWIFRGRIGRYGWLWVVRWIVRVILVILIGCWILGD